MPEHVSTASIAHTAKWFDSAASFFARFPESWEAAKREVLKLETRQVYREPGNASWEALQEGGLEKALPLLPASREVDVPLYASLRERGVAFVRCRPVSLPLTLYLQWEFACYDFNERHGELINIMDLSDDAGLFERYALHDFMVFDDRVAFIHDYDAEGQIRGGWQVTSPMGIASLSDLFQAIRRQCIPFREFLATRRVES